MLPFKLLSLLSYVRDCFSKIHRIPSGSVSPAPSVAGPLDSPSAQTCTTDLKRELQRLRVPGLAAGIVKNGRLVCTAVAGMANIEQNRPVTPDALFILASVSKTITATALMQLYDQGHFKLDDNVNKYLPFQVHIPAYPTSPITFHQLLTHTSSIIDNDKVINSLVVQGDSPIALGDFLREYLTPGGAYYHQKANFLSSRPGIFYRYSNVGATLLGYLVETISGTSFDQFCRDHIFTPLAMSETSFKLAGLDPSHIAMPYGSSGHRYSGTSATGFKPYGHYGEADWPDGMLRTSVPQLARFLIMFMQFGEYQGQRILAQSTVQEMRRVQIPQINPHQGLIWYYHSFGNSSRNVLGHNGSDDGVASNMFFDPATGAGVILIANGDWNNARNTSPAADALMDKLFQEAKGY